MPSYLLQDWVTVRADANLAKTNIPQAASQWLDLGFATDVTFMLEVAQRNGGSIPKIHYETAPLRDDWMFQDLAAVSLPTTPTLSITPVFVCLNPSRAVARWVRWRLTTNDVSTAWDVTFRLTVMAYPR